MEDLHDLSDRPVNLSETEHELSDNGEIGTTQCINIGDCRQFRGRPPKLASKSVLEGEVVGHPPSEMIQC